MPPAPKAAATLFYVDGKTLDVVETQAQVVAMLEQGVTARWCVNVTKVNGDKVWTNLIYVCRIEPA